MYNHVYLIQTRVKFISHVLFLSLTSEFLCTKLFDRPLYGSDRRARFCSVPTTAETAKVETMLSENRVNNIFCSGVVVPLSGRNCSSNENVLRRYSSPDRVGWL